MPFDILMGKYVVFLSIQELCNYKTMCVVTHHRLKHLNVNKD